CTSDEAIAAFNTWGRTDLGMRSSPSARASSRAPGVDDSKWLIASARSAARVLTPAAASPFTRASASLRSASMGTLRPRSRAIRITRRQDLRSRDPKGPLHRPHLQGLARLQRDAAVQGNVNAPASAEAMAVCAVDVQVGAGTLIEAGSLVVRIGQPIAGKLAQ